MMALLYFGGLQPPPHHLARTPMSSR